jgi:hypothetical protein
MTPEMIEKEHIPQYAPVNQDVLSGEDSRKTRMQQLMRFLKGGNAFQVKAKIVFQTLQGLKAVNTTIWNVSETHVALKGGLTIPVHSILEVQA